MKNIEEIRHALERNAGELVHCLRDALDKKVGWAARARTTLKAREALWAGHGAWLEDQSIQRASRGRKGNA